MKVAGNHRRAEKLSNKLEFIHLLNLCFMYQLRRKLRTYYVQKQDDSTATNWKG
jgi:hypothetical protein